MWRHIFSWYLVFYQLATRWNHEDVVSSIMPKVTSTEDHLVDKLKLLGVTIDRQITLSSQVSQICWQCNFHMWALRRTRLAHPSLTFKEPKGKVPPYIVELCKRVKTIQSRGRLHLLLADSLSSRVLAPTSEKGRSPTQALQRETAWTENVIQSFCARLKTFPFRVAYGIDT